MKETEVISAFFQNRAVRLAVCAAAAVGILTAIEGLCGGKSIPLWEQYGPWITEHRVQAIAILTAVLYGSSLVLWPIQQPDGPCQDYSPCE